MRGLLSRVVRTAATGAAIAVLWSGVAHAQAVSGTLLGSIADQGGLAMPGVTVTITETSTNISLTATTNDSGFYTFPSLKDGTYKVVAELSGFKRVVRDGIIVPVNTTVRVDLKMEVGALEESITVVGQSPILQTDRTDTGRIIESKMVSDMPLTFNRNFQSILLTVPGTTRPHREHSQFFNSQDSLAVEVNGQPRLANNTLIEGLDNNHKTGLLQVIIPAADALETVSVSTSNYDAEFGRSGGAVTNVTLKSGTNQVRGSVFVFGNTDATNASDYFTHLKAPTKFLNSGLTLGGPIIHNKFFFFGDYQRTIDNNGYVVRATVPTMAMRSGDFSAVTQRIYDPFTGDVGGNNRVAFPANIVPANRISPIAQKLIGFIPEPNIAGAPLGQNNYQKAQTREKTTDGFDMKFNYSAGAKDQLSYRVSFMRPVVYDPGPFDRYEQERQHGRDVDPGVQQLDAAGCERRTQLLPQHRAGRSGRPEDQHRCRHPGCESRRLHEWLVAFPDRRLHRSDPGILAQPAVGPLREDLEHRDDADEAEGDAHDQDGRRMAQEHGHAATDAGCRRLARPFHLQRLGHGIAGRSGLADRSGKLLRRVPT
jgi:Carboxypeptidase regulatory-like domain